jgi:vacuolar-type H+-ATPase subunit H
MPVLEPDRTVADAIDRVLEAEHAAAESIRMEEATARATLDAARETRRRILERARQRVIRLHERAAARCATQLARLDAAIAMDQSKNLGRSDVAQGALATVARRLTTDEAP